MGLESKYSSLPLCKFAVVPVPFEKTVCYGHGTAKGPAAVIEASTQIELWDEETKTWVEDVWTTDQVWDDNSKMMDCYVPSQGIALNPVLAKWLSMYIPPIPPSFTFRPAQYIVKTADGSQFAVELKNYISNEGKKCCFTIKYRKL